jgi:HK97 family phage major capsid protein/HK97 family phage prohead protease
MNANGFHSLAHDLRQLAGQELRRFEPTEFRAQDEDRTLEFSFSSELPVDRWFGREVLSHSVDAVDLARLNDGAPVLFNHDPDRVIGVVERAWVDGEKKRGMTRVRFSRNEYAQQVLADITDGILRNVSVGYMVKDATPLDETIVISSWEPHEVSIVSIPADPSVGIGRSLGAGAPASAAPSTPSPTPMEDPTFDIEAVRAQAQADERTRVSAIIALCREHNLGDKAQPLIERGASVTEAQAEVLAELAQRAKAPQHAAPAQRAQPIAGAAPLSANIGLTEKEARSFSFLRAIRAQVLTNNQEAYEAAAFEREVSAATQKVLGVTAQGYMVPHDVMGLQEDRAMQRAMDRAMRQHGTRAMSVGTATLGGDMVAPDFRPETYIERLINRLALTAAGISTMSGLNGPVSIPRVTAGPTAFWVGENGAPSESSATLRQVDLTPKTLGAFTEISRLFMLQSSIDAEAFVRSQLLISQALEIDRVGLYGTGSSAQPQGIRNVTAINTVDFGADNPTYAEMVAMETAVNADNADVGAMSYITSSARYGGFKTTEKASSTAQFLLEPGNTVNGYPVIRSNQVAAGDVFFGVWSQLMLGLWGGIDLQTNPYSLDTSGAVRVTVFQSVDYAVRYADSFCRGNNNL